MKSILNNVVYIDIETTGLHEEKSEIIEISAIKIKDGSINNFNWKLKDNSSDYNGITNIELKYITDNLLYFLEDFELICHSGELVKRFLKYHIPSIKNKILDLMELAAILEPWRKEYSLDSLLFDLTNRNIKKKYTPQKNVVYMIEITNALLCRLWYLEERNPKKKSSLYKILIQDYGLLEKWSWTKYLEKPLFFNDEEYKYVVYEKEKVNNISLDNIKIKYSDFEDLLKQEEIWNNGGDFNYQYRESQRNFSKKIRENIENEEKIFIEAPTGSGKTFAYLLIAILEALINEKKKRREDASFIISTDTKELQNQLIDRDIPNLLRKLGLLNEIKYGAMKGKGNYICTDKLRVYKPFNEGLIKTLGEIFLKRLCKDGEYGDIENISYFAYKHFQLEDAFNEVICDSEECNLEKCYKPCYLRKRYLALPNENITVVNHSLLASWPYGEKKKITHLIIDEAHNLMDKCYDFFSEEFNTFEFRNLLVSVFEKEPTIYRYLKVLNSNNGYKENIDMDKIKYWVDETNNSIEKFLNDALSLKLVDSQYSFKCEYNLARDDIKVKIDKLFPILIKVKDGILGLYSLLNRYFTSIVGEDDSCKDDKEFITINTYLLKLKSTVDIIEKFIDNPKESKKYAKVIEISNDYSNFIISIIPLNVDELFNEIVLKEVKSTAFLSATMRINNSFNRIKNHLGQKEAKELIVPPTFNLRDRTKIYSISDIGRYNSSNFIKNSARFIYNLSEKLNGHILVLFTNNLRLKGVEEELKLLTIGSKTEIYTSKKAIRYLSDKKRKVIILGSKSFFEGIDVPGDGLTAVILDKLPNKNLEDPLLKAITTYQNKNYKDVNYPQLCIKVKQIYGRLIRSTMDYGYFCILDSGNNNNTLKQLEYDLKGPMIINISSSKLLLNVENDYRRWQLDNLKKILNNKNISSIDDFNNEAIKNKSFWELKEVNKNSYTYKNLNNRVVVIKKNNEKI